MLSLLATTLCLADPPRIPVSDPAPCARSLTPDDPWHRTTAATSRERMLRNISPQGAARGAVIASPSTTDPNYFYHWIRDAALTMDVVVDLWERETDPVRAAALFRQIWDYLSFSRQNQLAATLTGLGEPKFEADGRPFNDDWGRPQNDGPALRAITAIRVAHHLLAQGRRDLVTGALYRAELPALTLI